MTSDILIPHLFRTEYRKIVSVLCRRFGFRQIEIAEDIASETFLVAAQAWGVEGAPPNPVGWLYQVARNKAKNYLQRGAIFDQKVAPAIASDILENPQTEIDLSPNNINDSQLQMMFAICDPGISSEAQIGLSLRILCGFGIGEIADAFNTSKEVINKRLTRARERLREYNIPIEMPESALIEERLDPVLLTIYLVFNEGYYSQSQNKILRKELCLEAMRLCTMLVEHPLTNKPKVNALLALMCFHASRFEARTDESGELILYEEQDTQLWNSDLSSKGAYFLNHSKGGNHLSRYHLEAGIAFWHTQKGDTPEKWEQILHYFNLLLQIQYSPAAALNRTYALYKARGAKPAIAEAEKLNLTNNYFYYLLLAELFKDLDPAQSSLHLEAALAMTRTEAEKRAIARSR